MYELSNIFFDDEDETLSIDEFNKIADEVFLKIKKIKNNLADDGEALSKDVTGRNSHNVVFKDDDEMEH